MARSTRTVFFDANVLAAPVTRTPLLVGIVADDVVGDVEQARRAGSQQASGVPRHAGDRPPCPYLGGRSLADGHEPEQVRRHQGGADRQILADAAHANAAYLITNDVDDFAEADLVSEKIAAVNPDLFMALRFSESAYQRALAQLVASLNNPPKTIEQMHALIGRKHRRPTSGLLRSTLTASR